MASFIIIAEDRSFSVDRNEARAFQTIADWQDTFPNDTVMEIPKRLPMFLNLIMGFYDLETYKNWANGLSTANYLGLVNYDVLIKNFRLFLKREGFLLKKDLAGSEYASFASHIATGSMTIKMKDKSLVRPLLGLLRFGIFIDYISYFPFADEIVLDISSDDMSAVLMRNFVSVKSWESLLLAAIYLQVKPSEEKDIINKFQEWLSQIKDRPRFCIDNLFDALQAVKELGHCKWILGKGSLSGHRCYGKPTETGFCVIHDASQS